MAAAPGRFSDELLLIDYRDDAVCTEFEKVVIDLAEDRFGHAVVQMNATVRVNEVVFVVVTEKWSEAEAFDVKIGLGQEPRAAGAKSRTDTIATITIRIQRHDLHGGKVLIERHGAE
jgi:hypothetical protein